MTMRMLWLGAFCCLAAAAGAEKVSFTVETDHTNARYRCGEVATFTVTARPVVFTIFGEPITGTARQVSGTITWNADNTVSMIV